MSNGSPQGAVPRLSSLATLLRGYQSALDEFDEAVAEALSMNRTDLRCLDLISVRQPITAGELAKASGLSTGATTFVLDRLERGGFVVRRRDATDRRKVLVGLVPAAHARAFALHLPLVLEMRGEMERFVPAEVAVIERFLSVGQRLYHQHAEQLRAEPAGEADGPRPAR